MFAFYQLITAAMAIIVLHKLRTPNLEPGSLNTSNIPTSFIELPMIYDTETIKKHLTSLQVEVGKWKSIDWTSRMKKLKQLQDKLNKELNELDDLNKKIKLLQEENNQL